MSVAAALHTTDMATHPSPVAIGATPETLERIRESGMHLAVWRRGLPDALRTLSGLDWSGIADIDTGVAVDMLAANVPALLHEAGYDEHATFLADEIVDLGQRMAGIAGCHRLRLRLEVIETDACCKFHADYVTVRLLMPLVGPGTQWRRADDAEAPVNALETGDIALFKGRKWAEDPAILHRSPPVAATGETRLLLAIDPLFESPPTD